MDKDTTVIYKKTQLLIFHFISSRNQPKGEITITIAGGYDQNYDY